mmetsp:Transcript_17658/g.40906  ORF Transcript_17658/g.40906 Transcript_17658/m.40906 type:complete len:595 (+) Transcript_17658:44-1828(+)
MLFCPSRYPHRQSLLGTQPARNVVDVGEHADVFAVNSPLASGVSRSVSGHGLGVIALPPRRHGGNGQPAPSTPAMPARSYPIVNQVKGGFAPTSPGEVNRLSSKPASFVAAAPVATSADVCRVPSIQSEAIPEQPERSAGARLSAQPWQWERRSASGAGTPTPPAGFVLRNQSWQAPLIQKQPTSQPTRATTASAWKPPGMGSGVHHAPRRWDLPRTPEKVELQAGGVGEDDTPPKGLDPARVAPVHALRITSAPVDAGQIVRRQDEAVWKGIPTPVGRTTPGVARRYGVEEEASQALSHDMKNQIQTTAATSSIDVHCGVLEAKKEWATVEAVQDDEDILEEFSVTAPHYGAVAASRFKDGSTMPPAVRSAVNFLRCLQALPRTDPGKVRPLLPPLPGGALPTIVLDLDETLAHCSRGDSKRHRTMTQFKPSLTVTFDDQPARGGVAFRPYVHQFLEAISEWFEVVIFTASQQSYADKVINALDPLGKWVSHRLYRQHCTELRGAFFKELTLLGREASQCILVDNSPISVACNPDNGILIRSWYGDPSDQELVHLLVLLKECLQTPDMGFFLSKRFGLRDFFHALSQTREAQH